MNKIKIKKDNLLIFLSLTVCLVTMLMAFKGDSNLKYYQNTYDTKTGGPFELTISTSRYLLTEALVNNNSLHFNNEQASKAAPDISYHNGKYFSIFTPGVSLISVPLYILGQSLGIQQAFTFLLNIIIQLINILLIIKLAKLLNIGTKTALFTSLIFTFSTNSLAYALTFSQHTITTMFVLIAVINSSNLKRTKVNNSILGSLYGIAGLIDIPNFFILLPTMLYAFYNSIPKNYIDFKISSITQTLLLGISTLPFLLIFGFYNFKQTGSAFSTGQFLGRADYPAHLDTIKEEKKPVDPFARKQTPLYTRDQMRNFYLLTISNERGILYYSPILLIGIIGTYLLFKENRTRLIGKLIVTISLVTLVLYSLHGDPWGGWAFSSRYMIVPAALVSATMGVSIQRYIKRFSFNLLLLFLLFFSTYINILGALTTNAIPPKVEAVNLPNPIPYTFELNQQYINSWNSSFVYNRFFSSYIEPIEYFFIYLGVVSTLLLISYFFVIYENKKTK